MPVISIYGAPTDQAALKQTQDLSINVIVLTIEDFFFLVVETNDMHQIISLAESHHSLL